MIPHPVLRRMALEAHRAKRESVLGAAAFAAFVPISYRSLVVRAAVAYQLAFDYIDGISEQAHDDPVAHGRQLNQALLHALEHSASHTDYYANAPDQNDGGYLISLLETVRHSSAALPSYGAVADPARRAAKQIICYQSLNHGDGNGSYAGFIRWAHSQTDSSAGLWWWEAAAASGSTLPVLTLLAAAADPATTYREAEELERAYVPWIAALSTLLDSLIDQKQDAEHGNHNLVSYYASPEEAAKRLQWIAAECLSHTRRLRNEAHHAMLLAAMVGLFHTTPTTPAARLATRRVLDAMGEFARPTLLVLGVRKSAVAVNGRLKCKI
jgi:tetraprenyl-beta-curcumene synthase